jgi:hypothetical protein
VIATVHGRGYRFVATAELLEEEASRSPAGPRAGEPAFVGRAESMAALVGALDQSVAGRGRVALVVGEPGIGKSRTLEQLGAAARRRGVRWLAGRCWEAEGAPAFWPFREALRPLAPRSAERARQEDDVLGTLGAAAGEQARFRWFESVARELRRACERAPLLLSVDDLHWADGDTLRLFLFLARELRDAPLLLVGTYRDVEVRRGHPLARVLGDLAREPQVLRVTLRGLSAAETTALAESVAGAALEAPLARALAELTEGNPFFVQEMARWLCESGRLAGGGAHALALPQGVRDAVGRRLDALAAPTNALLRVAAVIGREFSASLLAEVAGVAQPLLALSAAAEAGIVQADPELPGRFRFAHALVRQTLYEELPVAASVALHRRVAEALARNASTPAAELAHHWFEALPAGTAGEAVRACAAAAEEAHARLAYAESARQFERALEALGHAPPDEAKRCELLIALGEERWTDGEREAGRVRLAEAADLARRIGRDDLLARAAIGYRGFGELGMPPDAKTLALLEEGRDALGAEHPILRSRILARLTGTPPYSTSMAERDALAREAWSLAGGSDDRAALVDAIGARYWATLGPDRLPERLAVARDAHALAGRYSDRRLALLGHEIAIGHHLVVGDLTAADHEIAAYDHLADEVRQPVFRFLAGLIRGSRALGAGDFASAEEWIREAHARGRGTIPYADFVFAGQVVVLLFLKGELDRVAEIALSLGPMFGERFAGAGRVSEAMAAASLDRVGRRDEAREHYERLALHDFADIERDEHWLITLDVIADLALDFEDARRAAILYDRLLPYRALLVSHDLLRVVTEPAEAVLGTLALATGRAADALAHYERALERALQLGLRPAQRLAREGLARARQLVKSPDPARTSPRASGLKKSSTRPRDRSRRR